MHLKMSSMKWWQFCPGGRWVKTEFNKKKQVKKNWQHRSDTVQLINTWKFVQTEWLTFYIKFIGIYSVELKCFTLSHTPWKLVALLIPLSMKINDISHQRSLQSYGSKPQSHPMIALSSWNFILKFLSYTSQCILWELQLKIVFYNEFLYQHKTLLLFGY